MEATAAAVAARVIVDAVVAAARRRRTPRVLVVEALPWRTRLYDWSLRHVLVVLLQRQLLLLLLLLLLTVLLRLLVLPRDAHCPRLLEAAAAAETAEAEAEAAANNSDALIPSSQLQVVLVLVRAVPSRGLLPVRVLVQVPAKARAASMFWPRLEDLLAKRARVEGIFTRKLLLGWIPPRRVLLRLVVVVGLVVVSDEQCLDPSPPGPIEIIVMMMAMTRRVKEKGIELWRSKESDHDND